MWFAEHEPEVLSGSAHLLFPKDYLTFRLTGWLGSDFSDASNSLLLDVRNGEWDVSIASTLGLDAVPLPVLTDSTAVVGRVSREGAAWSGLPEGVPVAAGAGDSIAAALGARALHPFGGPPYLPFVAWAKRAEPVRESPLGILIHPDYGLWHAYRGALAFKERLDLPPPDRRPHPCDSCVDKPCLSACPVAAFSPGGYEVDACAGHIAAAAGRDCLDLGCRARRACPIGRKWWYEADQAAFHMAAFLRARQMAAA